MKKSFLVLLSLFSFLFIFSCKVQLETPGADAPEENQKKAGESTVTKIEISKPAEKLEYFIGDELDTTGLEITAVYSDNTSKVVTEWTTEGFDSSEAAEEVVVTVKFQDKTASYTVSILNVELTGIEITAPAEKTEYYIGDELDTTGLEVTASYSNGESAVVNGWTVEDFDSTKETDSLTLTVKYGDFSDTFDVVIIPLVLQSISVSTGTARTEYTIAQAEEFSIEGLVVTAYYNNGSEKQINVEYCTADVSSAFESIGFGKTVTVTYEGKTTDYQIDVIYAFHDTPKKTGTKKIIARDAAKSSSVTKDFDIVEFGDWPRSVMPETFGEEDITDRTVTSGAYTYNLGKDGYWYYKHLENAYDVVGLMNSGVLKKDDLDGAVLKPKFPKGMNQYTDGTEESKYSDGSGVNALSANNYRWFKVEPLTWRVLTSDYNGSYLLMAEEVITGNVKYYIDTNKRTINGNTITANNYQYSTIRAYLNGSYETGDSQPNTYKGIGFFQTAFTSAGQGNIIEKTIDNSPDQACDSTKTKFKVILSDSYYTNSTTDKVFLLSEKELTTREYGFNEHPEDSGLPYARVIPNTDFALANSVLNNGREIVKYNGGYWWNRSPSDSNYNVRLISLSGWAGYSKAANSMYYGCGVVPALCVSSISE